MISYGLYQFQTVCYGTNFLNNLKWANPSRMYFPCTWGFQLNVGSPKKHLKFHLIRHITSFGVSIRNLSLLGYQQMLLSFAKYITHGQNKKKNCSRDLWPTDLSTHTCWRMLTIIQHKRCILDGFLPRVIVGKFNHRQIPVSIILGRTHIMPKHILNDSIESLCLTIGLRMKRCRHGVVYILVSIKPRKTLRKNIKGNSYNI